MTLSYVGAGTVASAGPTAGILNWKSYVLARWPGGMDLGTWGVRTVRGGSTLSVHAVGRAWDWRYADPGPGRHVADEAIDFTIRHHELLGLQAVHDYTACRIWRSSRPDAGPGWKTQPRGGGMGAAWAAWLHFEVHPSSPLHRHTVADVLQGAAVDPGLGSQSLPAAPALPLPTLRPGDRGVNVVHLQQVLRFWDFYDRAIDGVYGSRTTSAVTSWQVALRPLNVGPSDGIYGPRTHAAAAASYGAFERLQASAPTPSPAP